MKTLENWPQKQHTYGRMDFFPCSPDCLKRPKNENSYRKFVSIHICSLICGLKSWYFEASEDIRTKFKSLKSNIEMLVGVALLHPSFPPSETQAFYFINRPSRANISGPSVSLLTFVPRQVQQIELQSWKLWC